MPCRSEGDEIYEQGPVGDYARRVKMLEAALCGIMRGFEKYADENGDKHIVMRLAGSGSTSVDAYDLIDFEEAGITLKELDSWWKQHKAADDARRARESREARERKIRENALAKLTAEEKRLLNLR